MAKPKIPSKLKALNVAASVSAIATAICVAVYPPTETVSRTTWPVTVPAKYVGVRRVANTRGAQTPTAFQKGSEWQIAVLVG
jgi:hypothetical protein